MLGEYLNKEFVILVGHVKRTPEISVRHVKGHPNIDVPRERISEINIGDIIM